MSLRNGDIGPWEQIFYAGGRITSFHGMGKTLEGHCQFQRPYKDFLIRLLSARLLTLGWRLESFVGKLPSWFCGELVASYVLVA